MEDPVQGSLDEGDFVVAISDGFFEWSNASGELFGIKRLEEVIMAHRNESATDILSAMEHAVHEFVGDLPQQDDVTGLVIKRLRS